MLGVLSTGLNPAIEGFSYMPWDAYGSLFSRSGQQVLVLLAGAGFLIWLFVSIRKAKYAGLEKDGRNFYLSNKGTCGTARFMSDERMRRCFDVHVFWGGIKYRNVTQESKIEGKILYRSWFWRKAAELTKKDVI